MQYDYHPRLKEALDYIGENYPRDLSMSHLTGKIGISSSRLSALFKKELGMSFTCYLNRLRVGKARELIRNTDLTLTEIMTKVGFKTEQHFFKQFRRFAGVTPMSLRPKRPHKRIVE